ncbi:translation initiation factor IF-2 [Coemansia sp. RSA 552]|nr:translation initiation factor IF-2 [Coemansia sp. RSA 552]
MYAVPRIASVRYPSRWGAGGPSALRPYSSMRDMMQQNLDRVNRQIRQDTSNKWSKPKKGPANVVKSSPHFPSAGGYARNHLRSSSKAHSIPKLKSFFDEAEPAKMPTTARKDTTAAAAAAAEASAPAESAPVSSSKAEEPQAKKPEPPKGAARFFFMGKAKSASPLPSASWAKKKVLRVQPTRKPAAAATEPLVSARPRGTGEALQKELEGGRSAAVGTQGTHASSPGQGSKAPFGRFHETIRKASSGRPSGLDAERVALQKARQRSRTKAAPEVTPGAVPKTNAPARPERLLKDGKHTKPRPDERERKPSRPKRVQRSGGEERGEKYDKRDGDKERKRTKLPQKGKEVTLPLTITVDGLAKLLGVPNSHMMRKMANMGKENMASNILLSNEEAADVALEYGVVPVIPEEKGPELYPRPVPGDMSVHPLRPPVVTIMGHVDHGKTTLLDTLRSSRITEGEAGGITQHIGAFSVEMKTGQNITFLDTPGHAAFSAMRARGANATDIVILVVAADDGVMPQTKEAIQHAQDADVPIIVAVNKCDKPGVDPSRIKDELLQYGVQTEDLGGDIQAVEISALKGDGVEELAENIVTLAEVLDLRAEVDIPAQATVIESQLERGRGNVASVLVKRGTLKVGDVIVAGATWCKVRGMTDDRGQSVKTAGPATAVKMMGWKDIPLAGDMVLQAGSEMQAKNVVAHRIEKRKNKAQLATIESINQTRREVHERESGEQAEEKAFKRAVYEFHRGMRTEYPEDPSKKRASSAATADSASKAKDDAPAIPVVPIIIKGDVSGTVEAVSASLKKLPNGNIKTAVISTGVGPVTESDVAMLRTDDEGVIIAFNVKADKKTQSLAKRKGVEIMPFRVIYKLLEDVEQLLQSRLPPLIVEETQGEAVVQQVFPVTVKGRGTTNIAGCRVKSGSVLSTSKVRVKRGERVLFTGDIRSLRNVKTDISESTKGQECGIGIEGFDDLREGDIICSLRYRKVAQELK